MVGYAAMAVHHGLAKHVACVFADAPLVRGQARRAGVRRRARAPAGQRRSLVPALGFAGPIPYYALHAQRHMDLYGTTQDQLGAVALAARAWARMNPQATMREPLDLAGYRASPWVVEPFHVLDCCLVSNGAICVIVSAAERARDLAKPPVYVRGIAQAHQLEWDDEAPSLAQRSSAAAFAMAGCARDRHHAVRALRLLHVHGDHHARGLRLLQARRRRSVRRERRARTGRPAADEHGRRHALGVLHVGHDADLRGRDPGARRRRRAPGREPRPDRGVGQRRDLQLPRDARAVAAGAEAHGMDAPATPAIDERSVPSSKRPSAACSRCSAARRARRSCTLSVGAARRAAIRGSRGSSPRAAGASGVTGCCAARTSPSTKARSRSRSCGSSSTRACASHRASRAASRIRCARAIASPWCSSGSRTARRYPCSEGEPR